MCVFTLASLSYRQALLAVALLHTSFCISVFEMGNIRMASEYVTNTYERVR